MLPFCPAASDGFSLTSLYVDTSDPAYMASGATGQKRLRNLCAKLEELSDDRCRQLLQALLRSCEQVVGGAEAVKEDLACIKVVACATLSAILHYVCTHMHTTIVEGTVVYSVFQSTPSESTM